MTQDEIIEMVRDAGLDWHKGWTLEDGEPNRFETFANLVAQQAQAEEREACAKVCDKYAGPFNAHRIGECADAIRARGQA